MKKTVFLSVGQKNRSFLPILYPILGTKETVFFRQRGKGIPSPPATVPRCQGPTDYVACAVLRKISRSDVCVDLFSASITYGKEKPYAMKSKAGEIVLVELGKGRV